MKNWVDEVVEANSENEAPGKFFYWAALSAISAVMMKRVSINRHFYKLYPNIYVFLVAGSGMKKGIPVTLAKTLVSKAGAARIISGRNSMPRIIQDLGKAFSLENGGIITDAQGFLVSGELASFLVKDPDALTVLTDLHDTHAYEKEWINSLKGTGVDKLKCPCISLLGATNEEHFGDAVPQNAIGGGFIARTFIVFSNDKGKLNSLTEKPTKIVDHDSLADHLRGLVNVSGEFKWSDKAKDVYDQWYYPYMSTDHVDTTGTANRIGDQIIKVAMLLSLAEDNKLVLKEHHVLEAIKECMGCMEGMKKITMGAGKSSLALQTKMVIRTLLDAKDNTVERSKLLQKHWGDFDAFDLDRIVESLLAADMIDVCQGGKKTYYVMKAHAVSMYNMNFNQIKRSIQ